MRVPVAAYKFLRQLRNDLIHITSKRPLSCRYSTAGGNPRLMYAPVKEEVEWDEPRIIRCHDIISDREIEFLKNVSSEYLTHIQRLQYLFAVIASIISVSFLDENVACINQRIADITGLRTNKSAEELHVWQYLFFTMSDVQIGGATVFPKAGVALKPIKGSAVFWFNLRKNGDVGLYTEHAVCPVLRGNKWVANKWICEFGQEFRRPCSLSYWE
uniref:Zgc:152670 n=1 Tax=Sinocyclocheilus grahami TaxID=75366 RepID=A0A672RXJ4_SINGR